MDKNKKLSQVELFTIAKETEEDEKRPPATELMKRVAMKSYKTNQEEALMPKDTIHAKGMTLEFLGLWEMLHNPNFKPIEFERFKTEAGLHSFTMSPEKWIKNTNATGIVSKRGRYGGGTYAHSDIEQLLVLANIESYNAILISQGKPQSERLLLLREMVNRQLKSITADDLKLLLS